MSEPPFAADNFLATLLGEQLTSVLDLEAVCAMLAQLPIEKRQRKYALILYLDRVGVKLQRWMVHAIGGE